MRASLYCGWFSENSERGTPFSSNLTFASWTYDFRAKPPTLGINRIRCDEISLPKLIGAALKTARGFGLENVEVWDLNGELVKAAERIGGQMVERETHWPSLAWYGTPGDEVEWVNNELLVTSLYIWGGRLTRFFGAP